MGDDTDPILMMSPDNDLEGEGNKGVGSAGQSPVRLQAQFEAAATVHHVSSAGSDLTHPAAGSSTASPVPSAHPSIGDSATKSLSAASPPAAPFVAWSMHLPGLPASGSPGDDLDTFLDAEGGPADDSIHSHANAHAHSPAARTAAAGTNAGVAGIASPGGATAAVSTASPAATAQPDAAVLTTPVVASPSAAASSTAGIDAQARRRRASPSPPLATPGPTVNPAASSPAAAAAGVASLSAQERQLATYLLVALVFLVFVGMSAFTSVKLVNDGDGEL